MSCHVMSAWVVFWLGHLAISDAGTFSRRHRWVFVGPCHLCVHGPPAFPFDSGFLTHTHTPGAKKNKASFQFSPVSPSIPSISQNVGNRLVCKHSIPKCCNSNGTCNWPVVTQHCRSGFFTWYSVLDLVQASC